MRSRHPRIRTAMFKNPRHAARPHRLSAIGLPHPARLLAVSRALVQSAKRRARTPQVGFVASTTVTRQLSSRRVPVSGLPRKLFKPKDIPEIDVKDVYAQLPELMGLSLDAIRKALGAGDPMYVHVFTRRVDFTCLTRVIEVCVAKSQ